METDGNASSLAGKMKHDRLVVDGGSPFHSFSMGQAADEQTNDTEKPVQNPVRLFSGVL